MPRPKGSKIFSCPKCGERVVALPGEYGVCKSCGAKTKLTKVLLAAQAPIARNTAPAVKAPKAPQANPLSEPKRRGRPPAVTAAPVEAPKKRGRKPAVAAPPQEAPKRRGRPPAKQVAVAEAPKKRGRPPAAPAVVAEAPKKRGRKPGSKNKPEAAPLLKKVILPPKKSKK